MRKNEGRSQQLRGHKRHEKILTMRKNRSGKTNNHEVGQIYWNGLINDEAQRLKNLNISSESKIQTNQTNNVKPQMHRRKSGSA